MDRLILICSLLFCVFIGHPSIASTWIHTAAPSTEKNGANRLTSQKTGLDRLSSSLEDSSNEQTSIDSDENKHQEKNCTLHNEMAASKEVNGRQCDKTKEDTNYSNPLLRSSSATVQKLATLDGGKVYNDVIVEVADSIPYSVNLTYNLQVLFY